MQPWWQGVWRVLFRKTASTRGFRRRHDGAEAFVTKFVAEALDAGVLDRLARLDQHQPHIVGDCPLIQRPADELRPLISSERGGIAAEATGGFEDIGHALAVDTTTDRDLHRLLGAIADDGPVKYMIGLPLVKAPDMKSIDQM